VYFGTASSEKIKSLDYRWVEQPSCMAQNNNDDAGLLGGNGSFPCGYTPYGKGTFLTAL